MLPPADKEIMTLGFHRTAIINNSLFGTCQTFQLYRVCSLLPFPLYVLLFGIQCSLKDTFGFIHIGGFFLQIFLVNFRNKKQAIFKNNRNQKQH